MNWLKITMKVTLKKGLPCGTVQAPPSKSYAHRYLIGACVSKNYCKISNIYKSDDILATIDCLKCLGYKIIEGKDFVEIFPERTQVQAPVLNCRESGSTLRFLIPFALTLCDKVSFTGTKRLMERGISVYEQVFAQNDIQIQKDGDLLTFKGRLKSGNYSILGNLSSQYLTGLLFALANLNEESRINVIPPIESKPYIDITIDVLNKFNLKIKNQGYDYIITGKDKPCGINCVVEGDYSNSAFLEAFSYLGGSVKVEGLNGQSFQGDKVYKKLFNEISQGNRTIDIADCIDLGPILFVFASFFKGATFTGTKRLKIKESDRATAIKKELTKVNAKVEIFDNSVKVSPFNKQNFNKGKDLPIVFNGHNDHRIVMALSLFMTLQDIVIDGCEAVNKSYPDYFEQLKRLGAVCEYDN